MSEGKNLLTVIPTYTSYRKKENDIRQSTVIFLQTKNEYDFAEVKFSVRKYENTSLASIKMTLIIGFW